MYLVRRRLRLWVGAWLVAQLASMSAFLPADCCLAHSRAAHATEQRCHENAPQAQCGLRGTCDGPAAALVNLLSNVGVPGHAYGLSPEVRVTVVATSRAVNLIKAAVSPDPPPPRV